MYRKLKYVNALIITSIIVLVCFSACEVNRSGSGQWGQLPDLQKPKVGSNTDEGGMFRTALEDLANIEIGEDELLKTVMTFWDVAYFASGMRRDVADIKIIAQDPTNLYSFVPDYDLVLPWLEEAHVVFKVGRGLDDWVDPLIEEAKVNNPNLITIDLTRNVDLIGNLWSTDPLNPAKISEYNPWFWMNPDNMMSLSDTFYQIFTTHKMQHDEAMREGSGVLQHNMAIFPSSQKQMRQIQGKKIIQDVPAWPYFAKYFDIEIIATLMPDGKTDPPEDRLQALADKAVEDGVIAIFKTHGYGGDIADRFGEMTGLPVITLYPHFDPREGVHEKGFEDYFQMIMGNTNILLQEFRKMGLEEITIPDPEPSEQQPAGMQMEVDEETQKQLQEMAEKKAAEDAKAAEESGE